MTTEDRLIEELRRVRDAKVTGAHVRQLRLRWKAAGDPRGTSIEAFAEYLRVSKGTVIGWERDPHRRVPSPNATIVAIAWEIERLDAEGVAAMIDGMSPAQLARFERAGATRPAPLPAIPTEQAATDR